MPTPEPAAIDVTPEEERFLAQTFRGLARPYWIGGAVVAAAAALSLGIATDSASASQSAQALREATAQNARTLTAIELVAAREAEQNQRLARRLEDLEGRLASQAEATPVAADQRIGTAIRRLDAIEKRIPKRAPHAGLHRRANDLETRLSILELH